MSEVVVVGAFTALPGKEAEALATLRSLIAFTHQEDGCVLYALHEGADDPAKLAFIERWATRAALDAHLASSTVQEALTRVPELFGDKAEITVYNAVPGGEAKKGSLAAHAGG